MPEELPDSRSQALTPRGCGLAFPNDEDAVAEAAERAPHAPITRRVAVDLGDPVATIGGGNATAAAGVPMPKAAVHEDREFEAGGNEIGNAGQR